jgi:IclR family transcriptional regulator, KDG regulon repressor
MKMPQNQSLSHALDILFLFGDATPFLTVSEISEKLQYTQSKAYRLVKTLLEYHLLRENPGTAKYTLGLSAMHLGFLALKNLSLLEIARPLMKELSLLTKETVLLTAVNGTRGICLERFDSEQAIRYSHYGTGGIFPLCAGASGKILMAYLPEETWDRIISIEGLRRYTPNTITDPETLKAQLLGIWRKGYAFSDQEVEQDVRGVSAPIFNGLGQLAAGLSVVGPVYRIGKKKIGSFTKLVVEYSQKISFQIGFLPKVETRGSHPSPTGLNEKKPRRYPPRWKNDARNRGSVR